MLNMASNPLTFYNHVNYQFYINGEESETLRSYFIEECQNFGFSLKYST